VVKRIVFFKGPVCFEYDPRAGADRVVKGPTPLATRFPGLNANFAAGIDAAINWGDGFVYLFKGSEYYKFDALSNRTTDADPRDIADAWTTFPPAFVAGIDAAFNAGNDKAYFFSGDQYLRYRVTDDRVDEPDPGTNPYPRAIADPNGWRGLPVSFQAGLDAAVNAGEGKLYFFKNDEYVRLSYATRSVDVISPPYPYTIGPFWSGVPALLDCAVEWIQAGSATLSIARSSSCLKNTDPSGLVALGDPFRMVARFSSTGYPSVCGAAEYRQFIRGEMRKNRVDVSPRLTDPAGGPPRAMLGHPPDRSSIVNFQEDGRPGATPPFYGHRLAPPDRNGTYDQPDQRSGCHYEGKDTPLAQGSSDELVDIDLEFRGVIIDVAAGDEVIAEQRWTVRCTDVL
jgi:hypothetical protein